MNTEIKLDQTLSQLKLFNSQIEDYRHHPKSSKSLTKIVEELGSCLVQFKESLEARSLEPALKLRVAAELLSIQTHLDQTVSLNPRLIQLIAQISSLACLLVPPSDETEEAAPSSNSLKATFRTDNAKIGLKLAFFCDVDNIDHNGIITFQFLKCLKQEIPCLVTRSVFTGKNNQSDCLWALKIELENYLVKNKDDWAIYELKQEYGGGHMLILPRSLLNKSGGSEEDALKALDFDLSKLQPINLLEAFQTPQSSHPEGGFCHLFVENPKAFKIIYISGHGDIHAPAGMTAEQYLKFLKFLQKQHCKCLIIFSCLAGGASSLLTVKNNHKTTDIDLPAQPFPVLVKSIGDVTSLAGNKVETENEFEEYFDQLADFLEQKKPLTISNLKRLMENVEKNKTKIWRNYIKVHFPTSARHPLGFRPLGEHSKGYSLTHLALKKARMEVPQGKIRIKNYEFLCLHPVVNALPILFEGKDAALISMIPGNACHEINSLELAEHDPLDYLNKLFEYQDEPNTGAIKAFFINELKGKQDTLKEVVFLNSAEHTYAAYKQGNEYYIKDKDTPPKKISFFLHNILKLEAQVYAKPSADAILAAASNHETVPPTFSNLFGTKDPALDNLFAFIKTLNSQKKETALPSLIKCLEKTPLSREDKHFIAGYLLRNDCADLAFEFFKLEKLDVNMLDYHGVPVLLKAIRANHLPFVEYLLQNKANVKVKDKFGYFPLHAAVSMNNLEILKLILCVPEIPLDCKTTEGLTAIELALYPQRETAYQMLCEKGAKKYLIENTPDGMNALGRAVKSYHGKAIDFLLNEKADPNAGSPSAMAHAAITKQWEVLKKLTGAGGNLWHKDAAGNVPLVDVLGRASPEVIEELLKDKSGNMFIKNKVDISPMAAAFHTGNLQTIKLIASKNTENPGQLKNDEKDFILNFVTKVSALRRYDLLKKVLRCFPKGFSRLEIFIIDQLLNAHNANPQLVEAWIQEGLFHLDALDLDDNATVFGKLLSTLNYTKKEELQKPAFRSLIKTLSQHNEHESVYRSSVVNMAGFSQYPHTLLKMFLEGIADFTKLKDHCLLFYYLINRHDVGLLKIALQKGYPVHEIKSGHLSDAAKKDAALFKWLAEQGADINPFFSELIREQDHELIEYCLQKGVQLNPKDKAHPLAAAASIAFKDEGRIFKLLIEHGADMNSPANYEKFATPFAVLAENGPFELIQWALEKGAQINPPGCSNGITPTEAVLYNYWDKSNDALKLFLAKGGKINPLAETYRARSPLVQVIKKTKAAELVKLCLESGFDINDIRGDHTPLQAAAEIVHGVPDIFLLLINSGADVNKALKLTCPPLIDLLRKGSFELVQLGLQKGMTIGSFESQALEAAVESDNMDIFRTVLNLPITKPMHEYFTNADYLLRNIWKHVAVNNSLEMAKCLLELNILPKSADYELHSLLFEYFRVELMELLGKYNIVAKPYLTFRALDRLLEKDETGSQIAFFLQKGLDPNSCVDCSQKKILQRVLRADKGDKGKMSMLKALLNAGASPRNVPGEEFIPLFHAVDSEDVDAVRLLIEKGAKDDLHLKNASRKISAWELAQKNNNQEIINLLAPPKTA